MKQGGGLSMADERGAVAVFFAVSLPLLLAMSALVVDLAHGWETRRLLQNCVDGAALAGAYELDGQATGEAAAELAVADYMETYDNGFCFRDGGADSYSVDFYEREFAGQGVGAPQAAIRVTMAREIATFFGGILGVTSLDAATSAVAVKGTISRWDSGVEPFGLVACHGPNDADCPYVGPCPIDFSSLYFRTWVLGQGNQADTSAVVPAQFDVKYTVKMGSGANLVEPGNFQALQLGPPNDYNHNVEWGSVTDVGDCDLIETMTGNRVGPTIQGLYTDNQANQTWSTGEVKVSRINRDEAPWFPNLGNQGHPDANNNPDDLYWRVMHNTPANSDHEDPFDCPRVMYVPIIGNFEDKGGGKMEAQVLTFAIMFLDNPKSVQGRDKGYIDAYFWNPQHRLAKPRTWLDMKGLDPDSWLPTAIKLVE